MRIFLLLILGLTLSGCQETLRLPAPGTGPWLAVRQGSIRQVADGDTLVLKRAPFELLLAVLPSRSETEDWHQVLLYTATNQAAVRDFQPGLREGDLDPFLYNHLPAPDRGYHFLSTAERYGQPYVYDPDDNSGLYRRGKLLQSLADGRLVLADRIDSLLLMQGNYEFIPLDRQPWDRLYGCIYYPLDKDPRIDRAELLYFVLEFR